MPKTILPGNKLLSRCPLSHKRVTYNMRCLPKEGYYTSIIVRKRRSIQRTTTKDGRIKRLFPIEAGFCRV